MIPQTMDARPPEDPRHHLPRLPPEYYRGFAAVHWTMTIRDRRMGWLDDPFHAAFREVLLHGLARHGCSCPVYCLMPDHVHLLIVGWSNAADQLLFARFLKKHTNELLSDRLKDCEFQRESHDHVMRRDEIGEIEFKNATLYIADNPVKAGLVSDAKEYAFTRAMLPGFPRLNFWDERFWRIFWDATTKRMEEANASWNPSP